MKWFVLIFVVLLSVSVVFADYNSVWVRPQNCSCVVTGGGGNWSYFNNTYPQSMANFTNYEGVGANFTSVKTGYLEANIENVSRGNATAYTITQLNVTVISFGDNKLLLKYDSLNQDLYVEDKVNFIYPITYDSSRKQTQFIDTDVMLMTDGGVISLQAAERTPWSAVVQTQKLQLAQFTCVGNANQRNYTCINNSYYNMSQNCIWWKVLQNFTGSNQKNVNGYLQICYPTGTGWGGVPDPGVIPGQSKK